MTIATPPDHAEPAPLSGELPYVYALRAAEAKAKSILASRVDVQTFTIVEAACERAVQKCLQPSALAGFVGYGHTTAELPVEFALISADTIVVSDSDILGKPDDEDHAFIMLRQLVNRAHAVITGCCLFSPHGVILMAVQTMVHMWNCPDSLLRKYAQSKEPLDKAGAYAIQGTGAFLISEITGSWSNVVGLPFAEVLQGLQVLGALRAD